MSSEAIEPNDVIQLHLDASDWGPMLCIVDEVRTWGVLAYFLVANERGTPPGAAYIRVDHGKYTRIGRAVIVTEAPNG
jgi:hypothetical protein